MSVYVGTYIHTYIRYPIRQGYDKKLETGSVMRCIA